MTTQRMEDVGIVVDDLVAATAFFIELGLKMLDSRAMRTVAAARSHDNPPVASLASDRTAGNS